ncbi:protein phosphatase inhibitor 2-like [Rhodnius prolixus]
MNVVMDEKGNDPMENLKKKPTKSILKSSSSFEVPDGPSGSNRRASRSKEPKGTKWDELNILETLHPPGKDYGHMKIEEPKTPFERTLSEDTIDTLDPNILAEKIVQSCNQSPKDTCSSHSLSDSEEELSPEERAKKKEFEKRRKAHYNEFLMAKKAMKELEDEEDDDDD